MAKRTFEEKKAALLEISVGAVIRRLDRMRAKYMREREAVFAGLEGELFEAVKADPRSAAEYRFVEPPVEVAEQLEAVELVETEG